MKKRRAGSDKKNCSSSSSHRHRKKINRRKRPTRAPQKLHRSELTKGRTQPLCEMIQHVRPASVHHGAIGTRSFELNLLAEVPPSEGRDLETELSPPPVAVEPHELPFEERRALFDKPPTAPEAEVDACAHMTPGKAASVEAAEMFISRHYRA